MNLLFILHIFVVILSYQSKVSQTLCKREAFYQVTEELNITLSLEYYCLQLLKEFHFPI